MKREHIHIGPSKCKIYLVDTSVIINTCVKYFTF